MIRLLTPGRTLLAVVALSAPILATVALSGGPKASCAEAGDAAVLREESGSYVYTYHLPTGTEGLFDTADDPRLLVNLAPERPDLVRKLRKKLVRRLRVRSIEELRAPHERTTERLRGLGYL